jgi:hypothetical protein
MLSVVKKREEMMLQQGSDMLLTLRLFLSNSRNIWSLTAMFELLFILYAIIPWAIVDVCFHLSFFPTGRLTCKAPTGTPLTNFFKGLLGTPSVSTSGRPPANGLLDNYCPLGCSRALHPSPLWHTHLLPSHPPT